MKNEQYWAFLRSDPIDGETIVIGSNGITNYPPKSPTPTRSVLFERDPAGRITAIYDPNSLSSGPPTPDTRPSVRYVYNRDTGNLIQVLRLTDRSSGTYITNKYHYDNPNFPHYLTSIDNPLGVPVARNEYDDSGRLTAVVDAAGQRTEFRHNSEGRTEVIIDRLGHTSTFAYDLRGNVIATTNALIGVTLMAYDDNNYKTNEIAFLNGQPYATNRCVYTDKGYLQASFNPLGYSNSFTYNDQGEVLTSTDARGSTSTNFYDPDTGSLLGTCDALGNTTTNTYDAYNRLIVSRDSIGTLTTNCYNDSGNLTGTAVFGTTGSGTGILSTNTFAYDGNGNQTVSVTWRRVDGVWQGATNISILDAQGRVVQTIAPDGGTNTIIYDAAGRQQSTTDPLGRATTYEYDDQGRLLRTTYPAASAGANGPTESSTYDSAGNRVTSTDRAGNITTYQYDALNRLTNTIFADNASASTTYDDLDRVRLTTDARGVRTAFGYDVAGHRVAFTNAWGISGAEMTNGCTFDANGNQITFTDAAGRTTTNVFDTLNRVVEVGYADGTKTKTGYDAAERRVAETNQDSIVTRFAYDEAGRLVAVTNALGQATSYGYDEAGNQTNQVDALGHETRFTYDSMGRRIKRTLPTGVQSESMAYDVAGNLVRSTNFNGVVLTNQYDALNRLTNRSSVNGYNVAFTYTPTGQRQTMTDPSGVTTYDYDSRDRLTAKSTPEGNLHYAYDLNGNVTNIWSDPVNGVNGVNLRYAFDPLNRLTNVLANDAQTASYGFDSLGNLRSVRYANGVTNLYQYDPLNRLTNAVWWTNAVKAASFYYRLGLSGNRTNLVENLNGIARTNSWSYDPLYRLTNDVLGDLGSLGYRYDAVGNRTNRLSQGLVATSLPGTTNFLNANDWLTNDAYDSNGNTLWDTNATAQGPYYYDVENRLTNFNNTVYLTYNGDGIRVGKTVNGVTTLYLVDDRNPSGYAQVLAELTVSGASTNLARRYALGLSLISQTILSPQPTTSYYGFDGHGSVRFLTDATGKITDTHTYDAFGVQIATTGAGTQNNFLYCGEQYDSDLGMYYLRARYLSPGTGRFWTMDAFEGNAQEPLSLHKYLYANCDPVVIADPSGQSGNFIDLMTTVKTWGSLAMLVLYRATPTINRVTVVLFESYTGNTVMIGGGGAAVALKQGTRLGGVGWATWQWVGNFLKGQGKKIGTYKELAKALKGTGQQAGHLNQAAAFPKIPQEEGVCVGMGGSTSTAATDHWKFHAVLEAFWKTCRQAGRKTVTNAEFDAKMREGLEAAGFPPEEVNALSRLAEESRMHFGYHDGPQGLLPEVPKPIPMPPKP